MTCLLGKKISLRKTVPFIQNGCRKSSLFLKSQNSSNVQALTERQKYLIRQTWKQAVDCCQDEMPGVKIFRNIFRRCPTLKKLFKLEHVENLEDLPKEQGFIRHARVFSNIIDLTVRNIDELDVQIAPAMITFGRRHFYKHQIGFRPEYMTIFALALMDFIGDILGRPEFDDDQEVKDAWWSTAVYLVTKLKQGYELESMHKGKQRLHWPHSSSDKDGK